jgi:catalase
VGAGQPPVGVNATIQSLDRVRTDASGRVLTTNQGVAVGDNQNSLKAGLRGPTLLEDFILREKVTHFDHERIPERIAHARGSAAHGVFECTTVIPELTRAAPFQKVGKRTPVFVRFSTVAGERGSFDTARDVRPMLGTHSLVWDEAVKISGADPDFHRRDLWEAIAAGEYPKCELGLQVFTEEQAAQFSFDVLDATKIIPEELVPLTPVGRMVLDRNPDNFFAETEQVAFCTAHVVPGIDFSNDPLLAGRIHSYVDTQITRLGGPNFHEIPINSPLAAEHNNQRDGMRR